MEISISLITSESLSTESLSPSFLKAVIDLTFLKRIAAFCLVTQFEWFKASCN